MLDVLTLKPDTPFTIPEGVSQVEVDKISGYPAHDGFGTYKEWFINGSIPGGPDPIHLKVKMCKSDGNKLADQISISQGNYDEKEYVIIKEKDPLTNKDLWQKGINDWIAKQDNSIYKPPVEVCGASATMDIQIVTPGDQSRVDGDQITIRFSVASSKPIVEARIYLDGTLEETITDGNYIRTLKTTTVNFALNQDYVTTTPTPEVSGTATGSGSL